MEESDIGKVIVVCRFRPLNEKEQQMSKNMCAEFSEDHKSVKVNSQYENGEDLNFTFDYIFDPYGGQKEVYEITARPIIDAVFQGFNGTVLTYGQTSSGKTYTMTGYDAADPGIIPRLIGDLFQFISGCDQTLEFTVKVSFCEIYLEKIKDLMDPTKNNLRIQEDKVRGVHMPELTETYVLNQSEVLEIMKIGTSNREVSFTQMNATSSRSHSIFIINVSQNNTKTYCAKTAKLYLVDLAGSEKVGKTGAAGKRLEEAKNINKSLTTLGQVITALTDSKSSHIPYRDSKLTRVLQDSLGGNAKTTLILTCSPSPWNEAETISTLRFGIRAKAIKNKPKINKEYTVSELKLMLLAAKEEILRKDKIIESLKGMELNESRDMEKSFSVIGLCGNDIMETVQELERVKENLANEVRKTLKLQIENNEKQNMLDMEKRENERLSAQLVVSKSNAKMLDDEISIREENIRILAVKLSKIEQDLDESVKNTNKSDQSMKEIKEENEQLTEEIKILQQQLYSYKCTEAKNSILQANLEYEASSNKKLQEELTLLRDKLEISLVKTPNIDQIKENIKESVKNREKLRWDIEKSKMLSDFEQHLKKFWLVENEAKQCREAFCYMQMVMTEAEKRFKNKVKILEENNKRLKDHCDELNMKCAETDAEIQIEKERRLAQARKAESLEDVIKQSMERVRGMEEKIQSMQNGVLKENSKSIFLGQFRKIIKGGQNARDFSPSPMKESNRNDSVLSQHKGDKENINLLF